MPSCDNDASVSQKNSNRRDYREAPKKEQNAREVLRKAPIKHADVEVEDNGYVEVENPTVEYRKDTGLDKRTRQAMADLASKRKYQKKDGKLKRIKIAIELNRRGYRRSDGKKFKMNDIPQYP